MAPAPKADSSLTTKMDETIFVCAVLAVVIMLSVDELNPIKFVCTTVEISTAYAAYPAAGFLLYTVVANVTDIVYYATKIFFMSILSIFFREIDVIGRDNVPRHGPIIFTGNHANQFVDALQVLCNCNHKVGFLIAMKSWNQLVVGTLARCIGCIPVERPQDSARRAPGTLRFEGTRVVGAGTRFGTDVKVGDKLRVQGESAQFRVAEVHGPESLTLKDPYAGPSEGVDAPGVAWEVLKNVDQAGVFGRVFTGLQGGACIGIFPEGGSHDRTDLLPLKAGVAIIAVGALERHNLAVPVVPIGLNYFRRNRFRARAVVEFGPPVYVSEAAMDKFREGRAKEAYHDFLQAVEDGMRATLVTAPDERALGLVHMARRLWLPSGYAPTSREKQSLNRRFAEGYKLLLRQSIEHKERKAAAEKERAAAGGQSSFSLSPGAGRGGGGLMGMLGSGKDKAAAGAAKEKEGQMDRVMAEAEGLRGRLLDYIDLLQRLGLRDYQVPTLHMAPGAILRSLLKVAAAFALCSLPTLLLNAPVGLLAKFLAERHRKKALAGSRVKIAAVDVMLSKKITLSIVLVPSLWLLYAVLLYCLTPLSLKHVAVAILAFPVSSYLGIRATEAGMVSLKDLRPALLRAFSPRARKRMDELPTVRKELRRDLKAFIKAHGPSLGPAYNADEAEWERFVRKSASSADLQPLDPVPTTVEHEETKKKQ